MSITFLVAGATGFLGRHLVDALRAEGDVVRTLTRATPTTPDETAWDPAAGRLDDAALDGIDVVVNVAGSPTIGNPHSKRWARNLRESRVSTTDTLARAIASRADTGRPLPAFLAQNALGWYGDHGNEVVTEEADSRGDGLMTRVCREWQAAAAPAVDAGARVCFLRTVPVFDRSSPPLKQLLPLYRLGLGARLSDGRQFFPVISLRDWVAGAVHVARDESVRGPVNLCAPRTPTNAEFTQSLAQAVHRKALLAVPAFAIRLGAGEMAKEVLGSVNVVPEVLDRAGFEFRDRDVDDVLAAALHRP
jgi:uncharacterized protein (TIGR01777 family)